MRSNVVGLLAGGRPAAAHFFCSAKKSKQKKAGPAIAETPKNLFLKWEENQTRLRLRQGFLLIHFKNKFFGGDRRVQVNNNGNFNTYQ